MSQLQKNHSPVITGTNREKLMLSTPIQSQYQYILMVLHTHTGLISNREIVNLARYIFLNGCGK